jgi:hypothetical protein
MRRTILIGALIAIAGPANAQFLNPSPAPGPTLGNPAAGPTLGNSASAPIVSPPAMPAPPPAPPLSPPPEATGNVVTPGVTPPSLTVPSQK